MSTPITQDSNRTFARFFSRADGQLQQKPDLENSVKQAIRTPEIVAEVDQLRRANAFPSQLARFDGSFATQDETEYIFDEVDFCFGYQPWDEMQRQAGREVREALAHAFKTILKHVPPSADRSSAMRKLREARMDANAAITFRGRY